MTEPPAPPAGSFRAATAADADAVAGLHADSWRRFYRGAYTDAFLDGDVLADRRAAWSDRLARPGPEAVTILAEAGGGPAGFVHLVIDDDARWGSLNNLHVTHGRHRQGIGPALLRRAAESAAERGSTPAMYLWVLEQNAAAQAFYGAHCPPALQGHGPPLPGSWTAGPNCSPSGGTRVRRPSGSRNIR